MSRRRSFGSAGCLLLLLAVLVAYALIMAAVKVVLALAPYAIAAGLALVGAQVLLVRWRGLDLFRMLRLRLIAPALAWRRRRANPVVIVNEQYPPFAAIREYISPRMRFEILQRDGFRCQYCGRSGRDGVRLEVDHLVPVSRGGPTTPDNLVTACFDCNRSKHARPVIDYP